MLVSTTILIAFFCVVLVFGLNKLRIHFQNYRILRRIKGPPTQNAIVGNISALGLEPEKIFVNLRKLAADYFPVYRLYAMYTVGANILTPEDCEMVLSNSAHIQKGMIYHLLHSWLRQGLLTSHGQKWQTRRKILTPAFHFNALQEYVKVFNAEGEQLANSIKLDCGKQYVTVNSHIAQFALKTMAETSMGYKLEFKTQREIGYKQDVFDVGEILLYRLVHPWFISNVLDWFSPHILRELKLLRTLRQFTRNIIKNRENIFDEADLPKDEHDVYRGKKRLAMLDLLLLAKRKFNVIDDAGIQEEVDTFMFEGHDTTSNALGFALMMIACHPKIQHQLLEEMQAVLGDISAEPSYSQLLELKLMERCIKETLRLYPSVHFIARTLGADMTTHSGYLLPKETLVIIHIYDIHHNPVYFPNPSQFDPDRFLPENIQKRHPFAYLAFSAGQRNCIGQKFAVLELKSAICAILRNFDLEPIDTPETITPIVDIILRTKDPIKIKFVPRIPK